MFILPRIIGISTYVALFVLTLFFVASFKARHIKTILFIYLVALCIVAFFYLPYETADLYRIYEYSMTFSRQEWSVFWNSIIENISPLSSTPAAMVFYKIVGDTGALGLIPAVTCFVVYGVIFYILSDYFLSRGFKKETFLIVFSFVMVFDFFMPSIATVRSYISGALVCFCIYREYFKHKFTLINILCYFLAVLFHSIGIVFMMFRIFAWIFLSKKSGLLRIAFIIFAAFIIIAFRNQLYFYFVSAVNRFNGYTGSRIYEYYWEWAILFVLICLQLVVCYKFFANKRKKNNYLFESNYFNLFAINLIAFIICNIDYTFVYRWAIFSSILFLPLLFEHLNIEMKKNSSEKRVNWLCFLLIVFSIVCLRGYLCSLKFFE